MTNEIRIKDITEASFSIALQSLADGSGRSSASISNSNDYPAALISLRIRSGGTAPTADTSYLVYLLRDTGTLASDGWGGTDAAFTPLNAKLLDTIKVTANINTDFYGVDIDTSDFGPLGPTWGIAIQNESGQALNGTEANHIKKYIYYVPEVQ